MSFYLRDDYISRLHSVSTINVLDNEWCVKSHELDNVNNHDHEGHPENGYFAADDNNQQQSTGLEYIIKSSPPRISDASRDGNETKDGITTDNH